jgi:hypothetical protein
MGIELASAGSGGSFLAIHLAVALGPKNILFDSKYSIQSDQCSWRTYESGGLLVVCHIKHARINGKDNVSDFNAGSCSPATVVKSAAVVIGDLQVATVIHQNLGALGIATTGHHVGYRFSAFIRGVGETPPPLLGQVSWSRALMTSIR